MQDTSPAQASPSWSDFLCLVATDFCRVTCPQTCRTTRIWIYISFPPPARLPWRFLHTRFRLCCRKNLLLFSVRILQDFFRLYEQGMQERDAWGNQAGTVDARVEDEWDNIYVECQDCYSGSSDTYAGEGRRRAGKGVTSNGTAGAAYYSSSEGLTARDERRARAENFASFLDADFDYVCDGEDQEKEEKEREGGDDDEEGEGDDGEDEIIDCAIRGKWYFKDSDDQVSHSLCFSSCSFGGVAVNVARYIWSDMSVLRVQGESAAVGIVDIQVFGRACVRKFPQHAARQSASAIPPLDIQPAQWNALVVRLSEVRRTLESVSFCR